MLKFLGKLLKRERPVSLNPPTETCAGCGSEGAREKFIMQQGKLHVHYLCPACYLRMTTREGL